MNRRFSLIVLTLLLLIPVAVTAQGGYPPEVDVALADMNARLGTSFRLSHLVNWYWEERVFSDASMGCPLRGVEYAQVETPGFVIMLTVGSQIFEYRGAIGSRAVLFCGLRPAPPRPPDQNAPLIATGEWEYTATAGNFTSALAWSPSGAWIAVSGAANASGSASGLILLYNPDDLDAPPTEIPLDQPVTALDYAAANPVIALVTGSAGGTVAIFPVEPAGFDVLPMQTTRESPVGAVTISADRQRIASVSAAETDPAQSEQWAIHLWNATTGEAIRDLDAPAPVTALDFGSGMTLAAGMQGGGFTLYDAGTGAAFYSTGGAAPDAENAALPTAVRFSPNGRLLAVGFNTTVTVWNVTDPANPAQGQTFTTDGTVRALDFSADGGLLAAAGGDTERANALTSTIRIWEAATGTAVATLRGHTNAVSSLDFDPSGDRLASVSFDGTLRVWDFSGAVD
jgi:WD40 repeat protein